MLRVIPGGLLSAKPGLVMMHMGDGKGGLDPIFYVLDHADVPLKNLLPTHMTRKKGGRSSSRPSPRPR